MALRNQFWYILELLKNTCLVFSLTFVMYSIQHGNRISTLCVTCLHTAAVLALSAENTIDNGTDYSLM